MEAGDPSNEVVVHAAPIPHSKTVPKRIIKNQVPDSILSNVALNSAISVLPSNYNFERLTIALFLVMSLMLRR